MDAILNEPREALPPTPVAVLLLHRWIVRGFGVLLALPLGLRRLGDAGPG